MKRKRRRSTLQKIEIALVVFIGINSVLVCEKLKDNRIAERLSEAIVAPNENREYDPTYQLVYLTSDIQEIPVVKVEPEVEAEIEACELPELEIKHYTEEDVIALAQMAYGEAWVTQSDTEMAATMWVVLNRYDSGDGYYASCNSIKDVVAQPNQFYGYNPDHPVEDRLETLARDVLDRWNREKNGEQNVGRVLPKEYQFFWGDGLHNHFVTTPGGGDTYDWTLQSPYDT